MNQRNPQKENKTGLTIISIVLSCLLWFYVANQAPTTSSSNSVQVGLKYYNLGDGLTYSGPDKVLVRVWGTIPEKESIVAYIDLANLGPGTNEVPVKVEPVKGALFVSVEPTNIKVELKQISEHIFTIGYEISKNPPAGYQLVDLVTIPEKCVIQGQESAVSKVAKVISLVDLSAIKDTTSFKANLVVRDSKGNPVQGVSLNPETVTVYAVVSQKQGSRKAAVKPVVGSGPPSSWQVSKVYAIPDSVTLLGTESALAEIKEISTKPLDLSGKSASFSQEVELVLPEGVKAYPSKVLVNIEIEKAALKEGGV